MTDDRTLGAYTIFDLREMALARVPKGLFEFVDRGSVDEVALLGVRSVAEPGPEYLHFADATVRRPAHRADVKLLDTVRAAAEG